VDDFSFLDMVWTIFIIYAFVAYVMALFWALGDLFRDGSTSGWVKALWVILLIVLPLIGLLVYLLARGRGMAERTMRQQAEAKQEFDDYVRDVARPEDPATRIARAKDLLDAGTIDQDEFDTLKRAALST
jgi:hypothetical protein